MHDPGDEQDEPVESDVVYARERKPTSPDGANCGCDKKESWVDKPTPVNPGPVVSRFMSMAHRLMADGQKLMTEAMELHNGRVAWDAESRREWHGRLRRMGCEIDQFLSSGLP
jgi:hypothetical protein